MRFVSSFPLLVFALMAFNLVFWSGSVALEDEVLRAVMSSGALLVLTVADLLLLFSLLLLFLEMLKSAGSSNATIADHILSTGVFILALVEFLLVAQAGNAPFLMLVVICFMDVVAGYAVSIRTARRDISMK